MPIQSEIESVRVAVRIRPLVKSENDRGCQNIIEKIGNEPQVILKTGESYTYNFVFDPLETQEWLYKCTVKPMIQKLFEGYNVTILAYGQTGSGKTHTMGTAYNGSFGDDTGVIPRAMEDIFQTILDMTDYEFSVSCSFMELYQEQLFDLLSTASRDQSVVDIREDANKGIVVQHLTEISVDSADSTTECLIRGSSGRAVGATAMNAQSSRSHAIFTLNIQMTKKDDKNRATTSKFHLVDLAGSERSKKTKATGERFKEGVKINQGLLALGNVISALGTSQGTGFVGYRDSKLTRLLQDSLGGNSYTLMIACVSPADYNLEETLSTLRYADRARKIKNKPIVNQDPKAAEINRLNGIIQKLRLELCNKDGSFIAGGGDAMSSVEVEMMRKNMINLTEKNRILQQQLQATLTDLTDVELRASIAEQAHESLQEKIEQIATMVDLTDPTCSNDLCASTKKLIEIRKAVEEISGVLEKNKTVMLEHKTVSAASSTLSLTSAEASMANEAVQRRVEAFTQKQLDMNTELRKLNQQLGLKEALHQQVAGNLSKFCMYEDNNGEEKMKEYESMIQILEAEKTELAQKLKSIKGNPSAKIAEERRQRMQQLESQINELRKKNLQQAKMLKLREKESEKINNLTREIHDMKSTKVKLIRAMRAESENFRQWKMSREKELTQLKEKDRKRQNEMKRMETMHNKQRNVLKRKVEEAMAINKRLKEALEKRKTVQTSRKNNASGKVENVISWIDQELELIMSVVDAEHSLEHLMEDRAALTSRLQEIKESSEPSRKDISTVEEEIEMRNAQINDLQQRVVSSDIDSKMKAITEGLQSLPEARAALKHLFAAITEMRKEYAAKENKIEDMKTACEIAEEKIVELEKEIENTELKYKEEFSSIEKANAENIMVLLRELNSRPKIPRDDDSVPEMTESQRIQQEALDKMDSLREELDEYKKMYHEIKTKLEEQEFKKPKNKALLNIRDKVIVLSDSFGSEADEPYEDDSDGDPDWVKTPLRNRQALREGVKNRSRASKRGSDGSIRCGCTKGTCSKKSCTCRKHDASCSENCRCGEQCSNKLKSDDVEMNGDDDDSKGQASKVVFNGNETVVIDTNTSPNRSKYSIDSILCDAQTPTYPFSKKKREPFF